MSAHISIWKRIKGHVLIPVTQTGRDPKRLEFLDGVRGYAILAMLIGHVVGVALAPEYKQSGNFIYHSIRLIEGNAAPVFVFAAGMVMAYLLFRSRGNMNTARVKKGIIRGLHLLLLGFIMQVSIANLITYIPDLNPKMFTFLLRTHILHTLGVSIIVIAVLYYITGRIPALFIIAAFLFGNACFLVGPYISMHFPTEGLFYVPSLFLSKEHSYFAIFPWVGFALFGACIGFLAARQERSISLAGFCTLITIGYLVRNSSWDAQRWFFDLILGDFNKEFIKGFFTYYRLGEVLIITGITGALTRYVHLPEFLLASGRESLPIYFLHNIVVYGSIFGFGLKSVWYHTLAPMETAAVLAVITAGFIILAQYAERLRKKLPFLRFIS